MHFSNRIYFFCTVSIISFCFIHKNAFSQTKNKQVEILNANSLEYDETLGKNVKRLIGQVHLKQDDINMFCDSAYFYSETNAVDAYGKVHIIKDGGTDIYSDFLKYNGNTKMAEFQKNIKLIDNNSTLTTELLYYDMANSIANYPNGGTIISKENTLTSEKGYYNPTSKTFSFKKNVVLTNPDYIINSDTMIYNSATKTCFFIGPTNIKSKNNFIYCEYGWYNTELNTSLFKKNAYILSQKQKLKGDSIAYEKSKNIGKAFGNVSITDTAQHIIASGNYATYFEKEKKSIITNHALLKQYSDSDTLFLHADTICSLELPITKKRFKNDTATTQQLLLAYHKVCFYKQDLQGKCDSLSYSDYDSTMHLFNKPVLWSDKTQMTADKIELLIANGKMNKMFMKTNSFLSSRHDSTMFDQIKGKNMTGFFKDNNLVKILVNGDGQTIYFPKDKDKYIGANKADCSNLIIYLLENEVHKVTFLKKTQATLFPMSDYNQDEFTLKGFSWRGQERPLTVEDIFK
ncbi:MAG TPA: OstA-like protein [Bacteroidia bacterium]|nr:OstA-like protein [Bacteroidia bacterium]